MALQQNGRLIKAHGARRLGPNVSFNFDDLQRQSDDYVEESRRRAAELIDQAQAEAVEVRNCAFDEGREAGLTAGLAAAEDQIADRVAELAAQRSQDSLRTVLPALETLVSSLQVERERWLADWEAAAVLLSVSIAEKIIRRELSQRPALAGDLIRQALRLVAGHSQVKLRLNPQDLTELQSGQCDVAQCLSHLPDTVLVPDEAVSPGGCIVETLHGVIDARIETQLQRIVDELLEAA